MITVLQAPTNHGKSATLLALRSLLIQRYPNSETTLHEGNPDFQSIIQLPSGVLVGLRSGGDPGYFALTDLEKFNDCDFVFCASRSRGVTTQIIHQYASTHSYEIIWTKTYTFSGDSETVEKALNQRKANELCDLLEHLVTLP